jgi:hypothetical protein
MSTRIEHRRCKHGNVHQYSTHHCTICFSVQDRWECLRPKTWGNCTHGVEPGITNAALREAFPSNVTVSSSYQFMVTEIVASYSNAPHQRKLDPHHDSDKPSSFLNLQAPTTTTTQLHHSSTPASLCLSSFHNLLFQATSS